MSIESLSEFEKRIQSSEQKNKSFSEDAELKLEYLRNEIEHKAIYRVAPGKRLIPGKAPASNYSWQFYLRRCLFDPKFVFIAAELLVKKLMNKDVQIAACEDAGVPLGLAMSTILGTPMISIKKSRKAYGLLNFTEGVAIGKPILLVDDLAGSQNTLKNAVRTLSVFKLTVADEYATLINKTQGTHNENYINNKRLVSLFNCDDFAMNWKSYVEKFKSKSFFASAYLIIIRW